MGVSGHLLSRGQGGHREAARAGAAEAESMGQVFRAKVCDAAEIPSGVTRIQWQPNMSSG